MRNRFKSFFKRMFVSNNDVKLKMEYSGIMRFVPLIIVGGFFFITILLFAFGPLNWYISNSGKLYTFLSFCCIALVSGYVFSVYVGKTSETEMNINTNNIVVICSIVFFIMYIPTLIFTTGKWYPDIITGITETGKAYQLSKYYTANNSPIILYIRMLLSPFMIMVMPITLFFMPKLSKTGKTLGVLVVIAIVCMSIAQGVNKSVADFTAQIVLFLSMMLFSNANNKHPKLFKLKIVLLIAIVCITFFSYYSNSMRNRLSMDIAMEEAGTSSSDFKPSKIPNSNVSKDEISNSTKVSSEFGVSTEKENYFLDTILPERVRPMAIYLTSYLSHGYKGLSFAMEKDFTCTYGLGFSDFFRHNILKVIGKTEIENDIIARTYSTKTAEDGWETGAVWSSFFVYPASDISFAGTVVLVFIIGFFFGLSWKDALVTYNPFAIVSFFCFCTMIFYFSANNQMFQGGESFIGFISMLICWFISRRVLMKSHEFK